MPSDAPTITSITAALLNHVPEDVRVDLAIEEITDAVELYFPPVRTRALQTSDLSNGTCSTDGFYDALIDPEHPWIIYADDVHPTRKRFTIVHELGHHLLVTDADRLLDDLDAMAGSAQEAARAEETVCHRFAGRILVPDDLLDEVIRDRPITPSIVEAVRGACDASWEAVAVRVAERLPSGGAVVLMRRSDVVAFCASSPKLGWSWWRRGSVVDPEGPLSRALRVRQTARPETYRFGLGYSQRYLCDTLPIHDKLAVAVLSHRPSASSSNVCALHEFA